VIARSHNRHIDKPAKIAATTRCPIRISLRHFCPVDPAKWRSSECCLPETDNAVVSLPALHHLASHSIETATIRSAKSP
jgi:hypothetical protein